MASSSKTGSFILDQPYATGFTSKRDPDSSQTLDLFVPAGAGPFPLLVWIHGGGWHSGGKQPDGFRLACKFLPAGFALATIAYRLTLDAPFPAQLEDCRAALAWLRTHARGLRLDADRVGLLGHSAGAHLCALLATNGATPRSVDEGKIFVEIRAVVCWAPPCDLDRVRGAWPVTTFPWNARDLFCRYFFPGGAYDTDFARSASPIDFVHGHVPPILIVHGAKDTVVPPQQALAFAAKLHEAGVEATVRLDPDRDHDVMNGQAEEEALQFFAQVLKHDIHSDVSKPTPPAQTFPNQALT